MNKQQTITINGVAYNAHTGMRVDAMVGKKDTKEQSSPAAAQTRKRTAMAAGAFHASKATHSKTLNRRYVKSPVAKKKSAPATTIPKKAPQTTVRYQKSPMITKFAKPEQAPVKQSVKKRTIAINDIGPIAHPKVAALKKPTPQLAKSTAAAAAAKPRTNADVKKTAIEQALAKSQPNKKQQKKQRSKRLVNIASASLALVLFAGYLTYINMPSLSVRIAAAQSGIAATYPSFQPAGYSLKGPVAYENGEVTMNFASNSNAQKFALNQSKSSWDSSALLDNYVQQASNGNYQTFSDSGLTVYVYNTNAAWVNGGILHTITGDASLSSEQILHIATSM